MATDRDISDGDTVDAERVRGVGTAPRDSAGDDTELAAGTQGDLGNDDTAAPSGLEVTLPPAVAPHSYELGDTLGRYRLDSLLGEGGMGQVFRARDKELRRDVAVKVVHSNPGASGGARARTLREAQALAKLSHPNVVAVYDVGTTDDGEVWLAMELVEGLPGDRWMDGARPWNEVLATYQQVGAGLAAAHQAGLVHRDFKPSNFIVGDDGRPRVLDFGLARQSGKSDIKRSGPLHMLATDLTRDGDILGTPLYMSPEQMLGEPLDAKSDQFSFAVSLWQALYGAHPFLAKRLEAMRVRALERDYDDPGKCDVPGTVHAALLRALSPAASDRFESMDELLLALRPPTKRWPLVALAGFAAVAIGFGVYGLTRDHPTDCSDADAPSQAVWTDADQNAARAAFDASKLGFAADTYAATDKALRRYIETWKKTRIEVCEATHEAGTQSAELLDLRMACLGRRLDVTADLVALLRNADEAAVRSAAKAVDRLPDVRRCLGEADQLALRLAGPSAPEQLARFDMARDKLQRASNLHRLGNFKEARAELDELAPLVQELAQPGLSAQFHAHRADVLERLGEYAASKKDLLLGLELTAKVRDTLGLAELWRDLLFLEATVGISKDAADVLVLAARTAQEQASVPLKDQADFQSRLGSLAQLRGEPKEALEYGEAAMQLLAEADMAGTIEAARQQNNNANALSDLGRFDDAIESYRDTIAVLGEIEGATHPDIARIRVNLGATLRKKGQLDDATGEYEKALAVLEGAGEREAMASLLNNMGSLARSRNEFDQARRYYDRAMALRIEINGPEHPAVADLHHNLGNLERRAGNFESAEKRYLESIRLREKAFGRKHAVVAKALGSLAKAQLKGKRIRDSIATYGEAIEIADATQSEPHWRALLKLEFATLLHKQKRQPARVRKLVAEAKKTWIEVKGSQGILDAIAKLELLIR